MSNKTNIAPTTTLISSKIFYPNYPEFLGECSMFNGTFYRNSITTRKLEDLRKSKAEKILILDDTNSPDPAVIYSFVNQDYIYYIQYLNEDSDHYVAFLSKREFSNLVNNAASVSKEELELRFIPDAIKKILFTTLVPNGTKEEELIFRMELPQFSAIQPYWEFSDAGKEDLQKIFELKKLEFKVLFKDLLEQFPELDFSDFIYFGDQFKWGHCNDTVTCINLIYDTESNPIFVVTFDDKVKVIKPSGFTS